MLYCNFARSIRFILFSYVQVEALALVSDPLIFWRLATELFLEDEFSHRMLLRICMMPPRLLGRLRG